MKRSLVIFYLVALTFHAAVLFYLKRPTPSPPKMIEQTYVDIALTAPPAPEPPKPQPSPPVPQPIVEMLTQPKPVPVPEPAPKPAEATAPAAKLEPLPPPVVKSVVIPQPRPPEKYVSITEPKYARRVQAIYPDEAQRRHQQGQVTVMIYINESGVLDKVEIVKSSGYPLLDAAAVKAVRQSQFSAALVDAILVGARAEQTFTFELTR